MTRRNELIRTVGSEPVRLLSFLPYMELMTALEEDFRGLSAVHTHPLFNTTAIVRPFSGIYWPRISIHVCVNASTS